MAPIGGDLSRTNRSNSFVERRLNSGDRAYPWRMKKLALGIAALFAVYFVLQGGGWGISSNCSRFRDSTTEVLLEGWYNDDGISARQGGSLRPWGGLRLNNIAEDRPAQQSPTAETPAGLASHASDGHTDGNIRNGSCPHTAGMTNGALGLDDPWWRVDLGQTAPITAVEVWSREDCCQGQLVGAEVWVSYTSDSIIHGTKCEGPAEGFYDWGRPLTYTCQELTGQYVWVRIPRKNAILNLCQVVVLSTAEAVPYDPCFDPSVMTRKVDFSDPTTKYLLYEKSEDFCCGESHKSWSFSCAFGEAAYLNRTFVLDFDWCLASVHSGMSENVVKDLRLYYDVASIQRHNIVPRSAFLCYLHRWQRKNKEGVPTTHIWNLKNGPFTPDLVKDESIIIHRHFSKDYYYDVCDQPENRVFNRVYVLYISPELSRIKTVIQAAMGWDYDAVHVRRGDKARNKTRWPNVDHDTQPDGLLKTLPKFVQYGRNLYIATDEKTPHFFDDLSSKYEVFMLDQFAHLWWPGSSWHQAVKKLLRHNPRTDYTDFDSHMQAVIDYGILHGAKTRVETFNDLTSDNKHAVI